MGLFLRQLGRTLFIAVFFLTALKQIEKPQNYTAQLNKYYPKFHHWFMNDLNLEKYIGQFEPEWTKVNFIKKYDEKVIVYGAYFQLACCAGIFMAIPGFGFLLYIFILDQTLIYNNPFLAADKQEYIALMNQAIIQIGLMGGALMMCCGLCTPCNQDQKAQNPPKKVQQAEKQEAKKNPKVEKAEKTNKNSKKNR